MKDRWLIWSREHEAFWRPNCNGYTTRVDEAGRYPLAAAVSILRSSNIPADPRGYPLPGFATGRMEEIICPPPEMIQVLQAAKVERSFQRFNRGDIGFIVIVAALLAVIVLIFKASAQ